jgi:hypothetical protein
VTEEPEPGDLQQVASADPIAAYREAEEDWSSRARVTVGLIVFTTVMYGVLAFLLESLVRGPQPDNPSGFAPVTGALAAADALATLGARGGLTLVLALFAAEASLAIASSATRVDRRATPHIAYATDRWFGVLRASAYLLAACVCLVSAGAALDAARNQAIPADAPIILVTAAVACMLASAIVDRSDVLIGQVGILNQIECVVQARKRLAPVAMSGRLPWLWIGLVPVAAALTASVAVAFVESGIGRASERGLASLVAVGWVTGSILWARRALVDQARKWAFQPRLSAVRLWLGGNIIIGLVAVLWVPFALVFAFAQAPGRPWLIVLITGVLAWPVVCLAIECRPRFRTRQVVVNDERLNVVPKGRPASEAERRLRRQEHRLDMDLERWGRRTELPPLRAMVTGGLGQEPAA